MSLVVATTPAPAWLPPFHELIAGLVALIGFCGIVAAMLLQVDIPHDVDLLEAGALAWTFGRASA